MAIEDPFVWVMGPQRFVTLCKLPLEMFLLTYLLLRLLHCYTGWACYHFTVVPLPVVAIVSTGRLNDFVV